MAGKARVARIGQLQSLRFVAAALVVYGHVLMEARQHGSRFAQHWTYDLPWGGGVDIFFVISGFIIPFIARGAPRTLAAASDFMARRIIRLGPLYWLCTLAMVAVMIVMPESVREGELSMERLTKSLLFIPDQPAAAAHVRPVLAQGWTLICEFFFYVVFAALMVVTLNRFVWMIAILLAGVIIGATFALPATVALLLSPFLLLFAAGMALEHFRDRLPHHGTIVASALIVAALAWAAAIPADAPGDTSWRMIARGIPAILIVYATLQWHVPPRWITSGMLPLLGDASYALYLTHPFVANAVLLAFGRLQLPIEGGFVATALLASIVASVAILRWIDLPIARTLTRAYTATPLGRRPAYALGMEPAPLAGSRGTKP